MLGLGSSCNNDEGYAKGERYRERFHKPESTYHAAYMPYGRDGKEADWIGDFSDSSGDGSNIQGNAANIGISNNTLRVIATANSGYGYIGVSVVPYTSYTFTCINDPNDAANSDFDIRFGTSHGASDIADIDGLGVASGATVTATFNSGNNNSLYISFVTIRNNKGTYYDDVSFKES